MFRDKKFEDKVIDLCSAVTQLNDKVKKLEKRIIRLDDELCKELGQDLILRWATYGEEIDNIQFKAKQITTNKKLELLMDRVGCKPVKTSPEIKLECKKSKRKCGDKK